MMNDELILFIHHSYEVYDLLGAKNRRLGPGLALNVAIAQIMNLSYNL
jgi:hypothetical protein